MSNLDWDDYEEITETALPPRPNPRIREDVQISLNTLRKIRKSLPKTKGGRKQKAEIAVAIKAIQKEAKRIHASHKGGGR